MRKVAFSWALAIAVACGVGAGAVFSAWAATPGGGGVVRLDGPADLAALRAANPTHYALALKILAEANHLCRPTAGQLQHSKPEGELEDAACGGSLLNATNPPKREIRFVLEHTVYIATVTLTDDPPRLASASSQR